MNGAAKSGYLQTACAIVAAAAIVIGAWAAGPKALPEAVPESDYEPPILALEMMADPPRDVARFVGTDEGMRASLVRAIHFDYGFIGAYVLLFFLIAARVRERGGLFRAVGWIMVAGAVAAGIADVFENGNMLSALAGHGGKPRCFATIKWSLLFLEMLGASFAYGGDLPGVRRLIGWTAASLGAWSGVVGLGGLVLRKAQMIAGAVEYMTLSLVVGWLFFATRSVLASGLAAFLNRLATSRPLQGCCLIRLLPDKYRDRLAEWRPLLAIARWPTEEDRFDA
jgi:hypothetical protein